MAKKRKENGPMQRRIFANAPPNMYVVLCTYAATIIIESLRLSGALEKFRQLPPPPKKNGFD